MGNLHRPHRSKLKKNDWVRVNRGTRAGDLAFVIDVHKNRVSIQFHDMKWRGSKEPWKMTVKKSAVKKVDKVYTASYNRMSEDELVGYIVNKNYYRTTRNRRWRKRKFLDYES